ncbi:hypothetical protein OBBRIDRAFT_732671 [Obba rivulosa]|uniref:Uncharacterized protein n=1 Tax=Obba rivulosa TaxID=1052685 RepID=A0A8E2AWK8_9APHY|nr:hypothetical protein OBBRIDRAFT_732671 [Obba rivulosa]
MSPDTPEPCVSYAAWNLNPTFGNQHHFLHSASTSFQLPLDSDLLYFIGTGAESQLEGSVDISNSPDIDAHHVKVEISAFYDMVDILEWTRVCLLQRSEKKHGVGIFTAVPWPHKPKGYQAFFEVKIRLPPRGNSPLRINHMETDLPYFSHDVGDIGDTVFFNTVSIASKSAPIFVHSLSAERASISTYDAWVVGSFESSSSLKIEGHGSTITANVTLLNDDSGVPTELYLQDGSESIEARINLTSTSDTRTGGSFKVDARTSGSKPINITFPYAPIDSKIHVDARTWGAPVEVRAHETFEGTWSTRSSPDADLVTDMITMRPDPSGRERVRNGLDWGVTAGVREGNIYWGHPDDSKKYGEIRLQTFNAPAQLFL